MLALRIGSAPLHDLRALGDCNRRNELLTRDAPTIASGQVVPIRAFIVLGERRRQREATNRSGGLLCLLAADVRFPLASSRWSLSPATLTQR